MEDVARHTRLTRRGTVYWFRAKVPTDLRDQYGRKREITFSLRTKDPREALEKVRIESVKLDQEFKELRRRRTAEPVATLSDAEIERLAAIYRHQILEEDEEARIEGLDDRSFRKLSETYDIVDAGSRYMLARGDTRIVESDVDDILDWNGIKLDKASPAYRKLCYAFLKASTKAGEELQRRQSGEVVETPPEPAPFQTATIDDDDDVPFSALWGRYRKERKLPEKTDSDFGGYVRRFQELHGDLPVKQIKRAHIRQYKDAMLQLPVRTDHATRKLTVPQLLEKFGDRPDVPRLSPRTVNDKALGTISAVLGYGVDNGYRDDNPASGIKVAAGEVRPDARLPYDVDDLRRIFSFPIFTADERPAGGGGDAARWLPLLAAFTGARLEELGQARVADLKTEAGIPYLDLRVIEQGKSLKRESSRRMIPIHPELQRCGFLAYVEQRRKTGEERLFPDLKSKLSKVTAGWSKWWGRYARDHGITDKRKVFHSFRHAFKDACRAAGIEEAIYDALQGHRGSSVGRSYGLGYPVAVLAEAIGKVQYPGLNLAHLHVNDEQSSSAA